jgi:hypothetical protein
MISLLPGDLEKIAILDKFLRSVTIKELNSLLESDLIVGKLRGSVEHQTVGPIQSIIHENNRVEAELLNTRSDILALRQDFRDLIKAVNVLTSQQISSDFISLKNKYSIY